MPCRRGRRVRALVTKVDPAEQKIALSIRALHDKAERKTLEDLAAQQTRTQKSTLGDLLAEKLAGRTGESDADS